MFAFHVNTLISFVSILDKRSSGALIFSGNFVCSWDEFTIGRPGDTGPDKPTKYIPNTYTLCGYLELGSVIALGGTLEHIWDWGGNRSVPKQLYNFALVLFCYILYWFYYTITCYFSSLILLEPSAVALPTGDPIRFARTLEKQRSWWVTIKLVEWRECGGGREESGSW